MARANIVYPELTDDLRGGFSFRTLKYFGAGAIMASVTIGSGETLFASRAGAIFGYALLWCFVGGAVMKGVQVYVGGRHMVLTGEHPMTHWGHLPGPRNWVPAVMALLSIASFPFWQAGLPLMLGQIVNWMFGIDEQILGMPAGEFKLAIKAAKEVSTVDPTYLDLAQKHDHLMLVPRGWATIAIVIAVTLTWVQSYKLLERVQVAIVGLLLASLMVACLASQPDWLQALLGFVPSIPQYPEWAAQFPDVVKDSEWVLVAVCLGAIGGGTYDYLGYLGCFREKSWGAIALGHDHITDEDIRQESALPIAMDPDNIRRGRRWLIPVKIDVGIGFLSVVVFTICFIVLGAAILHPDRAVPDKFALLSKQARFLTDFHPALLYVYQIGIFMAFWGTIYGAYEIYIRTAYECLLPISRRLRHVPEKTFRLGTLAYCAIGALLLVWLGGDDPAAMVKPAAILGGVFACGLWCFAMIWTDRRFLPAPLRMGPILLTLTAISGTVLTAIGVLAIWMEYLAGLFSL